MQTVRGVRLLRRCLSREMGHSLMLTARTKGISAASALRTCFSYQKRRTHARKIGCLSSTPPSQSLNFSSSTCLHNTDKTTDRSWFSRLPKLSGLEPDVDDSKEPLKMRYVFVTCCEDMWEEVPEGLKFDVAYLDSHPEAPHTTRAPVVMGIHGAPGSHNDLLPILQPMVAQGYRVIIPNLPGYRLTQGILPGHDDCFTNSPEENASFLAGFLTVIGIPRVDLVVGHSAGCYAALDLCSEYRGVQSALLINPAPHKPYRGIQPYWLLEAINRWWDMPMLRPFLKTLIYVGRTGRGDLKATPSDLAISLRACINVEFENVIHNLVTLKERRLPISVVFTDDDKFIDLSQFLEYYELLGGTRDDVVTFDSDTPPSNTSTPVYPRGVLLKGGGHYPLKDYPDLLLSEQHQLLRHINMSR